MLTTHSPFPISPGTDAVIFVVDANDRDRVETAREELHKLMNEQELQDAVVLAFANKQDLPNSMSSSELVDKLALRDLKHTEWYIQPSCAVDGSGLREGLDWLSRTLDQKR